MISPPFHQHPQPFDIDNIWAHRQSSPHYESTGQFRNVADGPQAQPLSQNWRPQPNDAIPVLRSRLLSPTHLPVDRISPMDDSTLSPIPHVSRRGDYTGQPTRRRISRACDRCNQLRTRCDGRNPCAHCIDYGLTCEYERACKKRGKASKKELAARQAAASRTSDKGIWNSSTLRSTTDENDDAACGEDRPPETKRRRVNKKPFQRQPTRTKAKQQALVDKEAAISPSADICSVQENAISDSSEPATHGSFTVAADVDPLRTVLSTTHPPTIVERDHMFPGSLGNNGKTSDYNTVLDSVSSEAIVSNQGSLNNVSSAGANDSILAQDRFPDYSAQGFGNSSSAEGQEMQEAPFRLSESSLPAGFPGQSPAVGNSPSWSKLPSPSNALYGHLSQPSVNPGLRYPVLRTLLPHVSSIIPVGICCDLLELYFSSAYTTFKQPQTPYVLGYTFRPRSFLRPNKPRRSSPALLASMLWVAAQTSESSFLTSSPTARAKVCHKLFELTLGLLKPLIHSSSGGTPCCSGVGYDGMRLDGVGPTSPQVHEMDAGLPGGAGTLDDVATYMHIAIVVSASEYKAASVRWWNAAWTLARELKLGKEFPPASDDQRIPPFDESQINHISEQVSGDAQSHPPDSAPAVGEISEEQREERRRVWWMLFLVDRHLALCYNRPLFLLDVECEGLLQPVDDNVWLAGEHYPNHNCTQATYFRRPGPSFECTSHSIFGSFLPLMTILGEVVELNHARNHPRFGDAFKCSDEIHRRIKTISQHLELYEQSLQRFEANCICLTEPKQISGPTNNDNPTDSASPAGSTFDSARRAREATLQTRTVVAYGKHMIHTLHILLYGKWDPINLLDDTDQWIATPSFPSSTCHAIAAANAIDEILYYDQDLSLMPYFFGIYLMQGSFLLLLLADKLQSDAGQEVFRACETVVRATEVCIVTLKTEYQRNFRNVMRSTLAQIRGHVIEDYGERHARRREMLSLYRWTGDGTGLAL